MRRIKCIALLLMGFSVWSVLAADYYVATNGSDSASGTLEQFFATIEHTAGVVAGDTVFIRGGNYHECVVMDRRAGTAERGKQPTMRKLGPESSTASLSWLSTGSQRSCIPPGFCVCRFRSTDFAS